MTRPQHNAGIPNSFVSSVRIRAGLSEYLAVVGKNLLDQAGARVSQLFAERAHKLDRSIRSSLPGTKCAIISDINIAQLFAEKAKNSLTSAGFQPILITIPAGEEFKTLEQVAEICDRMIAAGLDRRSFIIGLGGGVVGDISGFAASIFQRGIPHVQIPTTLLAMVDSSIGGKTGVNTRAGKNLLGAVHQPLLVIDDIDLLKTLPAREFKQGFAEIIKHAIIADADMFHRMSKLPPDKLDRLKRSSSGEEVIELVRRNIEIKSQIVAKDEHDWTGDRAILNFGHTVGHAIERAGNYEMFLHGEAISLGMVAATIISIKRAGLAPSARERVIELLNKFELPTRLPQNFARKKVFDALKFDKKFESGEIRFVVTPKIGSAHLSRDVTWDDIREAVAEL